MLFFSKADMTKQITISLGMLEISHMLREYNKWIVIVHYKL